MDMTIKVMMISMFTNIFLAISKIVIGFIGKSHALVADGLHSFSDLITDACAMVGSSFSRKPADEKHPYGHGRLEYVTSIIISLIILILGFTIIYNSINRKIFIPSMIVVLVSIITIICKFLLATYIIKVGKKYKNNILISSGYESSTDVISSVVVLISALLMQISDKLSIFKYSDMIASLIVGILIIRIGFSVLKENISIMLGEQETDDEYLNMIKSIILENRLIKKIDSLVLLKYGPYYKLISEVCMDANEKLKDVHDALDLIEKNIKCKENRIKYITIHVSPYEIIDND